MQALPRIDADLVKRLGRKKVRSLADLNMLPPSEREEVLVSCGTRPRSLLRFHSLHPLPSFPVIPTFLAPSPISTMTWPGFLAPAALGALSLSWRIG